MVYGKYHSFSASTKQNFLLYAYRNVYIHYFTTPLDAKSKDRLYGKGQIKRVRKPQKNLALNC